jgi:phenylalanyl-tRNA synthetase beta chain
MKFSLNWLREFVDVPANIADLTDLLTLAGVEIESVENRGANFDKVIVAQIVSASRHPNADRLTVCEVEDGSGLKRQIVCGATNYKVGDKVPLAMPGAVLPNDLKIRASKLRGVESEGMLCSGRELGLSEDASGLLILSPDAKIGSAIGDLFPNDTILDVEITPNRGDLLSHYGLAREIAALTGTDLKGGRLGEAPLPVADKGVTIQAKQQCPFFSARRIEKIRVGPSPTWLRARIESVGIRSINNIVDISNFVMLELGQPTHAFDADKLKGDFVVRPAREGEKFLALDGKTYVMGSDNLVIADQERAVGIGGVMGGEETGVSDSTTNVLLEAAYFLPASVRRTARKLNLPSDASYRFERGVDPGMILRASRRAAELMREIAGGNPAPEVFVGGELPSAPPDVLLRYERCNSLLGIKIEPARMDQILERFGLSRNADANQQTGEKSTWKIPAYRQDLRREVDLIEEIVRAHGVQKIAGSDRSRFTPSSAADHAHDRESHLRSMLSARGLHEARTSKLLPRNAALFAGNAIELRNPLSEDHVALRPDLITGLLEVLERNVRAGMDRVAIFELGRVFRPPGGSEERHLGVLLSGNAVSVPHWRPEPKRRLDLFDLKGAIDSVGDDRLAFRRAQQKDLALAVEILAGNELVGFGGQLTGPRAAKLDATAPVFVAELNLDRLAASARASATFREIDRFPAIRRDIALIVPHEMNHDQIVEVIRATKEPLLQSVELFDLFSGNDAAGIGAARKSLAYTLTYRDKNRTLTGDEVTAAHARIREELQSKLGAELREQVL